jgi:SAM-dependent methyltransferase
VSSNLIARQKRSFDSLVESGIYSAHFDHDTRAKAFVSSVLQAVAWRGRWRLPVKVLDCGCGTGAWLHVIHGHLLQAGCAVHRLCGFDLSERMIDVAHDKLRGLAQTSDIRPGNILEPQSYAFPGAEGGFDLIFTYDVVQQLPHRRQIHACFLIAEALAPGGVALVFDNDAETRFGRRMAVRKFLTRYLGLGLVPRYYCNATYPPLERIRQRLTEDAALDAKIVVRADGIKRALIIERGPPAAASSATAVEAGRGRNGE